MKKIMFIMLLGILALSQISAAGKQEKAAPGTKKVTIQFASASREYGKAIPELIARFEKENPNITVDWLKLPGVPNEQHTIYVTDMASESNKPDVITMDVVWPGEFIANNWVTPLDKYITKDELKGYLPGMVKPATYKGSVYGLPLTIGTLQFYYRTDLLKKYNLSVPKTWDDIIADSKIITKGENNPDLVGYISMWAQIEGLFMNYLQFLWGDGGTFFDANGNATVDTPEGIAALNKMLEFLKTGTAPQSIVSYKPNDAMTLFGQGRAVFMVVQEFVWPILNKEGSAVKGKVGVARIPYFPGHKSANTACAGGWILGINSFSDHPAESAKLIKFLTSRESALYMAKTTATMPARSDLEGSQALIDALPVAKYFSVNHSIANVRPSAQAGASYPELSHVMQKAISNVLLGKASPAQALASAQKEIDAILKK